MMHSRDDVPPASLVLAAMLFGVSCGSSPKQTSVPSAPPANARGGVSDASASQRDSPGRDSQSEGDEWPPLLEVRPESLVAARAWVEAMGMRDRGALAALTDFGSLTVQVWKEGEDEGCEQEDIGNAEDLVTKAPCISESKLLATLATLDCKRQPCPAVTAKPYDPASTPNLDERFIMNVRENSEVVTVSITRGKVVDYLLLGVRNGKVRAMVYDRSSVK